MVGHYLDVRNSENEWKLARIVERDKKYVLVAYDGINRTEVITIPLSKSTSEISKSPLLGCIPKPTLASCTSPTKIISPLYHNTKTYTPSHSAPRNSSAELSKINSSERLHHNAVSQR